MQNPEPGLSFVPEYQLAGLPWLTSSVSSATPVNHSFLFVTRTLASLVGLNGRVLDNDYGDENDKE